MSILILGGHEGMEKEYKMMVKERGYKTKIYTTMPSGLKKRIGNPDAIVLFMSTISHSMADTAVKDARRKRIPLIKVHNSSISAFEDCLNKLGECCGDCRKCKYINKIS